jgi:hypothetical protein
VVQADSPVRVSSGGGVLHSRRPITDLGGLRPLTADLRNPASLATALANVSPTHVFMTTWLRQASEAENVRVNAAMVRNLLPILAARSK